MTTSDPTTGEIAGAIRVCENKLECDVCPMRDKPCGDLYTLAADRLESQEREIAKLKADLIQAEEIYQANKLAYERKAARAEQAEKERDAAKAYMKRFGCLTCTGQGTLALNDPCGNCRDKSKWEMRGLPQDGEGK